MWVLSLVKGSEYAEGVAREARILAGQDRFVIGRDPACDWYIPDATLALSGRHCEIVRDPEGSILRDTSTNGTFLNGSARRMKADHRLMDGDRIGLGPYVLLIIAADDTTVRDTPPLERTQIPRGADPAAAIAATLTGGESPLTRIAPAPVKAPSEATSAKAPPAPAPAAAAVETRSPGVADTLADTVLPTLSTPLTIADPLAPVPPPPPLPATALAPEIGAVLALVVERLAAGLGVPVAALAGRGGIDQLQPDDVAALAERAGTLARTSLLACQRLGEQQSQALRQLGSRAQAVVRADVAHALRVAATPEQALLALMRAAAPSGSAAMQQAWSDVESHHEQLMAAMGRALERLALNIEPSALERAIDRAESGTILQSARKAALWDLYARVWQTTGLAAGKGWVGSFCEAGWLHLGAAYDEAAREFRRPPPPPL